jgi:hypothetical protein
MRTWLESGDLEPGELQAADEKKREHDIGQRPST